MTGKGAAPALRSSRRSSQQRPAAVTRLCTLVAADNRASLALLARAGRVWLGGPERGVLDVTVNLPAAAPARSAAEKVADFWAEGALKFIDQTHLLLKLPQADRIPVADRCFDVRAADGGDEPRSHRQMGGGGERAAWCGLAAGPGRVAWPRRA